jgi:hypothetical protein
MQHGPRYEQIRMGRKRGGFSEWRAVEGLSTSGCSAQACWRTWLLATTDLCIILVGRESPSHRAAAEGGDGMDCAWFELLATYSGSFRLSCPSVYR